MTKLDDILLTVVMIPIAIATMVAIGALAGMGVLFLLTLTVWGAIWHIAIFLWTLCFVTFIMRNVNPQGRGSV